MPLKAGIKRQLGHAFSRDWLEKLTEYVIAEQEPAVSLNRAENLTPSGQGWEEIVERGRRNLWKRTLDRIDSPDILLLEFGVWKGDSMREFVRLNTSERSKFYGFDSFEGLPEAWRGTSTARFDVSGGVPKIEDPRVTFVKGWFQDTLPLLLDQLERESDGRAMVVHFDADLYSSTLFLLFVLGARFYQYHFIFDEFSGHETRALFNFIQATGAVAEFFYSAEWEGMPQVVSGLLRSR